MDVVAIIRTVLSRLILVLVIIFFVPVLLIFMVLPDRIKYRSRLLYQMIHFIYWAIFKCSFLPITFTGIENIPDDEPVVFVANHQSSLDIPLVGWLSQGRPHIWLARSELLESFLFRCFIPHLAVVVDVNNVQKAFGSMLKILRLARQTDANIVLFPEGSRFDDGEIHEFFAGFAILAQQSDRKVIPVRIFGANKVYPVNSFLVHWHPIKVVVGKPMTSGEGESEREFSNRVRQWFIEQKEE